MELTIHWFWIIKLAMLLVSVFATYKATITYSLRNKVWNVVASALLLLIIVSPIKMQPTTNNVNSTMDRQIAERHTELPPMVSDDSFNQSANITGITQKDLK